MTIQEILGLRAGSELDRLVHERVMGYSPRNEGGWWTADGETCPACWNYSTSSAWALIVAETLVASYMPNRWHSFSLRTVNDPELGRRWHVMFRREEEAAWAEGRTPEEAICLAALVGAAAQPNAPAVVEETPIPARLQSAWDPWKEPVSAAPAPREPAPLSGERERSPVPAGART